MLSDMAGSVENSNYVFKAEIIILKHHQFGNQKQEV